MTSNNIRQKQLIILIIIYNLTSLSFLFIRDFYFNSRDYDFLIVNTILAYIPLLLAEIFYKLDNFQNKNIIKTIVFILWLLFYPNAFYIFTDFMHILDFKSAPLWFDTILLFTFSLNGLFIALKSLSIFHDSINKNLNLKVGFIIPLIIVFTSIGVYIGRFLRLNSWDILINPINSTRLILERYFHPGEHPVAIPYTIMMVVLFSLIYYIYRLISYKNT